VKLTLNFEWLVESVQSVKSCCYEAVGWGRREFGNPEPLEAATKQRLIKTEKTLCEL
jgi:hypothetical protein